MQSLTSFITRHSRAFALSIFLTHASICLQAQPASGVSAGRDIWQVPLSHNLMPHFEQANGRKLLYVDGRPFTVLAVEIPWWDLIYGRYNETEMALSTTTPHPTIMSRLSAAKSLPSALSCSTSCRLILKPTPFS